MTEAITIEEFSDKSGDLHLSYQKRMEGDFPAPKSDGPVLFFPRCSSNFELSSKNTINKRTVDAYAFAIAPANAEFQVRGLTSISDAVFFFPTRKLITEVSEQYNIDVRRKFLELDGVTILPRTNWLNEIMHRYVYERVVSKNAKNKATEFLEQEILKEIYYRLEEYAKLDKSRFDLDKSSLDLRSPTLRQAMDYIEQKAPEAPAAEVAQAAAPSETPAPSTNAAATPPAAQATPTPPAEDKLQTRIQDKLARVGTTLREFEQLRIHAAETHIRQPYVTNWVYDSNQFFTLAVRLKNRLQKKAI